MIGVVVRREANRLLSVPAMHAFGQPQGVSRRFFPEVTISFGVPAVGLDRARMLCPQPHRPPRTPAQLAKGAILRKPCWERMPGGQLRHPELRTRLSRPQRKLPAEFLAHNRIAHNRTHATGTD